MVSLLSALLHAGNTMKNTIDDADYIIDWIVFIIINQYVTNTQSLPLNGRGRLTGDVIGYSRYAVDLIDDAP